MNRKLVIRAIVVAVLMTSAAAAPVTPPTLAVNGCSLFNPATERYEVDSQSDLDVLGTDASCRGRVVHQTADIELNGWSTSINGWYGTFNGGGFRIEDDVSPTPQAPLFDNVAGPITMNNVHRSGNVTTSDPDPTVAVFTGGFVAYASDTVTITGSSMTGNVTATRGPVGGFVGNVDTNSPVAVEIVRSSMIGAVTGVYPAAPTVSPVGGFVGIAYGEVIITGSSRLGPTSGSNAVGGFVAVTSSNNGNPGKLTITNSYTTGDVSSTTFAGITGHAVGGFVGSPSDLVSINASYNSGNVTVVGDTNFVYAGGFIGDSMDIRITASYNSGHVTSTLPSQQKHLGGFAGGVYRTAVITDSYSTGDIIGDLSPGFSGTGGFIGLAQSPAGRNITINRSYTIGAVTAGGGHEVGEFVGLYDGPTPPNPPSGTAQNSFCRAGATNCGVDDPAAAMTSSELKSREFLQSRGWNFDQVWCVRDALNDGYPVLRAIDFGPGDTSICRPWVPIWRASLDPNGGTCVDGSIRSKAWTSVFVGYRYLPGATDCTRPGHRFAGWADQTTPSTFKALPLLIDPSSNTRRYFAAQNLDLIAVWTPDAASTITDLVVFANFLCGPCTTAWLIYTSPPNVTSVTITIEDRPISCNRSGVVFGLSVCELINLTPGPHTVVVTPTGGASTATTFTLRG